jgi:hypothetical protein
MEQFTIYDNVLPKKEDKKYSFRYLIVTNLISFTIGIGFHYLLSQ